MSETAVAGPVAVGRVEEVRDGMIVLGVPGTDYRVHLVCPRLPEGVGVRDRVRGTVRANARRVDRVPSGGKFIEPVFGRPRRLQGRVIGGNPADDTIVVDAGLPFTCRLADPRQKAADFPVGELVSFDIERGAAFEPMT